MSETPAAPKGAKDRSPSYPFIPLQAAIERLVAFEETFKRHPAPASKVGLAWKMKEASSQAAQTLAALKAFGLVDYQGSSADRVAVISEDGRTYLRAQQEGVKREVLKRLAMKPKAIEKYWQMWGADRPPDPICLDALVLKGGFTQSAAETVLRVYDDTVSFAGLQDSDKFESSDTGDTDEEDETPDAEEQPERDKPTKRRREPLKAGMKEDVFTLKEGDVVLQWPERLSRDSYADLETWTTLMLRKIKRSIEENGGSETKSGDRDPPPESGNR
jgi:hypothetical protein